MRNQTDTTDTPTDTPATSEQPPLIEAMEIKMVRKPRTIMLEMLPTNAKLPSPEPLDAMVESIRSQGIIYPVVLIEEPDGFVVVDGRRRIKAARKAELTEVPAFIFEANKVGRASMMLVLQMQRSANAVSEFEAINELISSGYADFKEIAKVTGIPLSRISQRMKLANLPKPLMTALKAGKITDTVAQKVAVLTDAQKDKAVEIYKASKNTLTAPQVADLRRVDKDAAVAALPAEMWATPSPSARSSSPSPFSGDEKKVLREVLAYLQENDNFFTTTPLGQRFEELAK